MHWLRRAVEQEKRYNNCVFIILLSNGLNEVNFFGNLIEAFATIILKFAE
jgi:hypothetical protein